MIPQRIADYLRERRIRRLSRALSAAIREGRKDDARAIQHEWSAEIFARSAEQQARMEAAMLRKMDPHARAFFERHKGGAE